MKIITVWILSCTLLSGISTNLSGQDYWDGGTGTWENENDGGYTVYFSEWGDETAVAVLYGDTDGDGMGEGGAVTTDAGEMKKAMEAAEDGHTYEPEGEDRNKWNGLPEQKEGESKGGWFKRIFGGKGKQAEGILDGCDPKKLDDWMNGRMPGWGRAIIIRRGQAPLRMPNPSDQAARIGRSIR